MARATAGRARGARRFGGPGVGMSSRPTLDDLDFAILEQLQLDGRRSFTEMARALGVSIGTVRNRYARLVKQRTLHVVGRADPHHVGFRAPANIHLAITPAHLTAQAAKTIAALPEVSYVAMVSGEYDLEVDVMCRDLDHLTELVTQRIQHVPGVASTRTNMILQVVKYGQPDLRIVRAPDAPD